MVHDDYEMPLPNPKLLLHSVTGRRGSHVRCRLPFEQVTLILLVAVGALLLGYYCLKRLGFVVVKKVSARVWREHADCAMHERRIRH